jgi:hypothetical protein
MEEIDVAWRWQKLVDEWKCRHCPIENAADHLKDLFSRLSSHSVKDWRHTSDLAGSEALFIVLPARVAGSLALKVSIRIQTIG